MDVNIRHLPLTPTLTSRRSGLLGHVFPGTSHLNPQVGKTTLAVATPSLSSPDALQQQLAGRLPKPVGSLCYYYILGAKCILLREHKPLNA